MEDVLEVYHREENTAIPLVCMDETSKQLVEEIHPALPMIPGKVACHDYEYKRNGVANLFLAFAPLQGWRRVEVTDRRTRKDWARFIQQLLEQDFPEAEKIVLVMDNLNTHSGVSLYQTFEPAKARSLLERLEIHYTPKHGSWLNLAEAEFSLLQRQCLDRRIPNKERLSAEVEAWTSKRNAQKAGASWHFTTEQARVTLKGLYPSIDV